MYPLALLSQALPQVTMPPRIPIPTVQAGGIPAAAPSIGGVLAQQAPAPVETATPTPGPGSLGFFDHLKTDPALQAMLLTMGANLMQPIPVGGSIAGQIGKSGLAGLHELQQEKASATQEQLQQRKQAEAEKTGTLTREQLQQQITQNSKKFPKLLEQLDAQITNLGTKNGLDQATIDLLKEKARLYPKQVRADLLRAEAAQTAAGKPSAGQTTQALFDTTAKAMSKTEGIPLEEAQARLGQAFFAKAGNRSAGVQTVDSYMQGWRAANPKKPGETDQQYQQRMGKAKTDYMTQAKQKSYQSQLADFIGKYGLFYNNNEEATAAFDQMWNHKPGGEASPPPGGASGTTRKTVTSAEVDAAAKQYNTSREEIIRLLKARGVTVQ